MEIHLENRKGWQSKMGWDGDLLSTTSCTWIYHIYLTQNGTGNRYNIYKQDVYAMDMYTHLPLWIKVLETELGRPLEDDDYIFPFIGSNGLINPKQPIKHDAVQNLFDEFTQGAGITKRFTTHCLRRGGAQYRLIFAPIGKRWSISRIRWWGGWADGEKVSHIVLDRKGSGVHLFQVDVLMKYLINSLINLEDGHQDALNPTAIDKSKVYLGEDELMKPMTRADVHYLKETIITAVETTVKTVIQSGSTLGLGAAGPHTRNTASASGDLEGVSSGYESSTVRQRSTPDSETSIHAETHQRTRRPKGWLPIPGVSIPNIGRRRDSW